MLSEHADELAKAFEAGWRAARRDAALHIFTMEHDGTKPEWIGQGAWAYTIEQASHRAKQAPIRDIVDKADT